MAKSPTTTKSGKEKAPRKQAIIDEIRNKVDDFETNMSGFVGEFNGWSDLFTIKRPATKGRSLSAFSNPRVTEMFRAVNALATMEVRMMTSQDPYFDLVPMDLLADNEGLSVVQAVLETQLAITQHKRHLLKACISKNLFGTVIVEEPLELFSLSPFGRRMPATAFRPRSLLQIAFDRHTADIDLADWLTTSDTVTPARLRQMLNDDLDGTWIKSEMENAIADESQGETIQSNSFIQARLTAAGYGSSIDHKAIRELILYYGKLDAMNDGVEYVVGLVNRKHIVRFQASDKQSGRKPFRVGRWVEFELEPYAYGLGKLLGPLHKAMDANRQKVQDGISFETYGMWIMNRLAGINGDDFKIKPFNIVEADDINALKRLETNAPGLSLGVKLEEILKSEFRSASGATDTLQAIITEATASEVSLAQSEAVRAISVRSEIDAESLVREHLEIMHVNNVNYVQEPLLVNVLGKPRRVYPAELMMDVDMRVKVTTDRDYKPERLKKMIEALQIMSSIRSDHPDIKNTPILPLLTEIMRSLGVPMPKTPPIPVQTPALPPQLPQLTAPGVQATPLPGGMAAIQTPVGQVLGSPA